MSIGDELIGAMQTLYPILYLEINLAATLLILFIRFKTLGISKMVSQRNFSSAIDAEGVSKAPYDLAVSIGVAKANRGKSLKTVLEEADAALYEEKRK